MDMEMLRLRLEGVPPITIAEQFNEPHWRVLDKTNKLYRKVREAMRHNHRSYRDNSDVLGYLNDVTRMKPSELDIGLSDLPTRAVTALRNEGANTLGQAAEVLPRLNGHYNFGRASFEKTQSVLRRLGLIESPK